MAMELSRQAAIRRMVEEDMGVGIVPFQSVREEVEKGRLVRWWIEGAQINWELGIARLSGGYESPIMQSFLRLARRHFGKPTRGAKKSKSKPVTKSLAKLAPAVRIKLCSSQANLKHPIRTFATAIISGPHQAPISCSSLKKCVATLMPSGLHDYYTSLREFSDHLSRILDFHQRFAERLLSSPSGESTEAASTKCAVRIRFIARARS